MAVPGGRGFRSTPPVLICSVVPSTSCECCLVHHEHISQLRDRLDGLFHDLPGDSRFIHLGISSPILLSHMTHLSTQEIVRSTSPLIMATLYLVS